MGMGNRSRPPMLLAAALVLAAEALALLAYTVLTVIAVATDQAYTVANGIAQIVMQLIMLTGLVLLASGVARQRPWTRTPSVMVQILIGFVAIVLLQGHRYGWGAPTLLLAAVGLVGLLTPASLKALARPAPQPEPRDVTGRQRRQAPAGGVPPKTGAAAKGGSPSKRRGSEKRADETGSARSGSAKASRSGNPAKRNPVKR